jgi:hypothetical protein
MIESFLIDVLQSADQTWQEFAEVNRGAMNAARSGWVWDEKEPMTRTDEKGRAVWSFQMTQTLTSPNLAFKWEGSNAVYVSADGGQTWRLSNPI